MAATTTLTIPTRTAKSLWTTGVAAGAGASVATTATAAIARAAGVSLTVGGQSIPLIGFAQITFAASIIGTLLAVVLARRATRPRRTFVVTTVALTLASIVPDVLADATPATRFTLALTHAVAAAIVIPALAARVAD
jgi:peptidoglycan/LPS O-acetylase OafA/YrhL